MFFSFPRLILAGTGSDRYEPCAALKTDPDRYEPCTARETSTKNLLNEKYTKRIFRTHTGRSYKPRAPVSQRTNFPPQLQGSIGAKDVLLDYSLLFEPQSGAIGSFSWLISFSNRGKGCSSRLLSSFETQSGVIGCFSRLLSSSNSPQSKGMYNAPQQCTRRNRSELLLKTDR